MGLFSGIGKALGGIGKAVGSIWGGSGWASAISSVADLGGDILGCGGR